MKVHKLTLAIAASFALALSDSTLLMAQGGTSQPSTPVRPIRQTGPITAGAFKTLSPGVQIVPVPGGEGDTVMSTVGHVTPPPPGPGPGGIPIGRFPHRGTRVDPASLVFSLQLQPGQKPPSKVGLQISDASGRVVYQTALACGGCTAQHGKVNLALNARAATAARPFMVEGNTMRVVTSSPMSEANPIHTSIGMRAEP